jgi:CheY-like chemotaxis protein
MTVLLERTGRSVAGHIKATFRELEAMLARWREEDADAAPDHPAIGASGEVGRIRVLVADDDPITRRWLFELIQHQPDMEVVGLASDGEMAVRAARHVCPHAVVLDIEMPGLEGPEAARRITAEFPGTRIVGLSIYDAEVATPLMKKAGAMVYVEKGSAPASVLAAIRGSL